jgi:hypothetical protein
MYLDPNIPVIQREPVIPIVGNERKEAKFKVN